MYYYYIFLICAGWGQWSQWSACSATCDAGTSTRSRRRLGERRCEGPADESRPCNLGPCEGTVKHCKITVKTL